ncbi:MAG: ADP-ribosylglycohydrolase family protein [Gemmataceae bacterium]|jgi:ADP-ribosylglycohydrolase|nr:ADP-ribosylglycohydrolase family protein [Gemmataceae bacterium]
MPDDFHQGSLFSDDIVREKNNHPPDDLAPRTPDGELPFSEADSANLNSLEPTEEELSSEELIEESTDLFDEQSLSSPLAESRIVTATERANLTVQEMNLGAVLGAAIGDAMGHPTEFLTSFEAIFERYGPQGVQGYELYQEQEDGTTFAPFTDDTQMAEIVLQTLVNGTDDLDKTMTEMASGFVQWYRNPKGGHRAPGNACISGCLKLEQGVPWNQAGGATSGGCGSVMRAYPFGLVFANDLEKAEHWAVEHSKLTHRDPIALASCAAMAIGMALIRQKKEVDFVVSEMVAAACRYCAKTAAMIATAIHEARTGVSPRVTLTRLEGWAAHEAIAAAVYIFCRHPNDPVRAILEAANSPGDSDSIATLVGAMVGCRCGLASFPEQWVTDLERTDELQELAKQIPT